MVYLPQELFSVDKKCNLVYTNSIDEQLALMQSADLNSVDPAVRSAGIADIGSRGF